MLCLVASHNPAGAAPGSLDTTFNLSGVALETFGTTNAIGEDLTVQQDGKILAVGRVYSTETGADICVVRYLPNGALDSSFGTGGKVVTPLGDGDSFATGVAVLADGRIIASGSYQNAGTMEFAVVRYTENGTLDSGFGNGGIITTAFEAGSSNGSSLAVQSDEKILVAGTTGNKLFSIVRYHANGTLDSGFGIGGKLSLAFTSNPNDSHYCSSVRLQHDGKILLAGYSAQSGQGARMAMMRLTSSGSLDSSFGTSGKVIVSGANSSLFNNLTVQQDGKILATGFTSGSGFSGIRLAVGRFNANGALDTQFGAGGLSIISGASSGHSVSIQSDGKIIVCGVANQETSSSIVLCRLTTEGQLDPAFGSGGTVLTSVRSGYNVGHAAAVQLDGKIVVTGYGYDAATGSYALAVLRYLGDQNPIVFIPGIAGSILEGGSPYRELWPTILPDNIRELGMEDGPGNVIAVDVMRTFYVEAPLGISYDAEVVYDDFLNHFAPRSPAIGPHILFDLARDRNRLTSTYMVDQAALNPQAPKPTFFPFPYDWRQSNATHTGTLRQYIKRIKELHGGSKVDIITHSMGGLLMRRYFLDFPADAAADVRKVVSVACPYWGAPKGVFRMLSGDFYDKAAIDEITSESMKVALATLPAAHELLPSNAYFAAGGVSVFREDGFDLNGNGSSHDLFFQSQYRDALDKQVRRWSKSVSLPSANNLNFHTSQQDSSLLDDVNGIFVPTLHLYGSQPSSKTTIRTKARARTLRGWQISLTGTAAFEEDAWGEGDGTVPVLSAERTSNYRAAGAALTKITDSNSKRVEHIGIMRNDKVWNIISNFLDAGVIPPGVVPTDENSTGLAVQSALTPDASGRKKIVILGTGYVRIRDSLGRENTQLSSIAANQIPGVTIQYGGDDPWVTIECSVDTELTIDGVTASDGIEMEVQQTDAGGSNSSLYRFRFSPLALSWKSSLSTVAAPTVHVDQNNSGTIEPNEAIAPTHTVTGSTIDTVQPVVAMDLAQTGDQVSLSLSATDNSGTTPSIRYSLDNGPIQNYSAPVALPKDAMHRLKVFAEDAVGNTSGLIDTTINPRMGIGNGATGITLQWPVAEAYVLEETADLGGPWHVSDRLATRTGYTDSVTIPIDSTPRRFFRLRSQRTER
jgi:uncharacterized delta-60 repeat protein